MDALSEVLHTVKFTGGLFLEARFTAPWCVTAQVTAEDCRPFLASSEHVIAYHYVLEGRLVLQLDGQAPIEVEAGEIVLLPGNDPHLLGSAVGLKPLSADELIQPAQNGGLALIEYGGGGPATRIVCGFLGTDETRHPLFATLPRILVQNVREGAAKALVEASVSFAAQELSAGRLASSAVMSRLSELLFVEAVRSYAEALPDDQASWLKGIRDPYVGRALALIHRSLREDWSTAALARAVALSRSAFAQRFTEAVGMPPMRYLTYWRLKLAQEQLRAGRAIAQIAADVGYESEAAFSRAFKREFGVSPARWRSRQLSDPDRPATPRSDPLPPAHGG